MSVECLRIAASATDLTMAELCVMIKLANIADKHGRCFPSQEWIADQLGITRKTVRTAMFGLERKGKIYRQERRDSRGFRTSDMVHFLGVKFGLRTGKNLPTNPTSAYAVGIKEEEGGLASGVRGEVAA